MDTTAPSSASQNLLSLSLVRFDANVALGLPGPTDQRSFCYGYGEALLDVCEALDANRPEGDTTPPDVMLNGVIATIAGIWAVRTGTPPVE